MTREEAIKFGKRVLSLSLFDETHEFCELAVKALEQESCEDAISRKAALDMATSYPVDGWDTYTPLVVDVEDIEELPSVTPQPKMGKWIKKEYWKPLPYDTEPLDYDYYDEKTHSEKIYLYCCSECGKDEGEIKPTDKYCPNCGCKMEVEE